MAKKTVLVVQPIHKAGIKFLEQEVRVKTPPDASVETLMGEMDNVQGVIIRFTEFPRQLIERARDLEVIGRHGVGYDNIDMEAAKERGIPVVYTPAANVGSVAEHAVSLMLALAKKLIPADRAQRQGRYQARFEYICVELEGKTVGVVGLGKIGSRVAEICGKGFNLRVLAYDPYVAKERAKEMGVNLVSNLDDLLKEADFVTIHTPSTKETEGLIGERELKLMKRTAFLINTARGSIINETALIDALKRGTIAGAGLDVFVKEPPEANNPLFKMDNVVVTPHMAAHTEEALYRMAVTVAEGVLQVLRGENPKYLANPEVWERRRVGRRG